MQNLLHEIFLRDPKNLFDTFQEECQKWYEAPAHSLVEMRSRDNKKIRGDVFENFCVLFLKYAKGYEKVWRLADVPEDVLATLGLKRRDMGIDIIAEKNSKYTAVQCKYKKHTTVKPKNVLSWKALSTFFALCLQSGPWEKHIVMTNCDYVRHAGKKTPKDVSICLKTFRNTSKETWIQMCELQEPVQLTVTKRPKTSEELRAARLAVFKF
jgi:predicted helicase